MAIVPARDEAQLLPETLPAVLEQRYDGELRVVLVDDASSDGTAEVAREVAARSAGGRALQVIAGAATPQGWAGKVWALAQGVDAATGADWLFLTDADIAHGPEVLGRLVAIGEADDRDVVSVMAELSVETRWEQLLVPAFVYFFQMLYPFRRVSAPGPTAAAAGGCMLVRAESLAASGGLAAMRQALIDDIALATQIARCGGRLWLGFSADVRSIRRYPRLQDLWQMVARSAYTELGHSPVRLVGALAGLALLFAVPPIALGLGLGLAATSSDERRPAAAAVLAGGATWLLQAATYAPTVRMYRLHPAWSLALPAAGVLYGAMTASSALAHARGSGVAWKERRVA